MSLSMLKIHYEQGAKNDFSGEPIEALPGYVSRQRREGGAGQWTMGVHRQ